MAFPLLKPKGWLFAAVTVLLASVYIFLTAKEFAASVFAARSDLSSLQRGVRLSPGNADYHHRLGRYFEFIAGDSQAAIESLRAAVTLNPYDAHYWFDLASSYQVIGDTNSQRSALEHALHAEPTAPDVAWEAANFFLINGDVDSALREFRVVVENDISLIVPALAVCWRARPDADVLLNEVVPNRPDTLIAFSDLLRSKNETEASIKTWERLAQSHATFDRWRFYDYLDYLLSQRRPDAAMALWRDMASTLGLSAYLPTEDNLIVNPTFSLDILDGGFDWNYVKRNGVRPELDSNDVHQGHRALSITFEGPGVTDAGVRQLIPVQSATPYDFSAYYKSSYFEGAGSIQIVLRDAYTGSALYTSDPLNDANIDFWRGVHSRVEVPKSTTLVVLNIERFPSGYPLRGKLWLGDFQLSPSDDDDSPTDPSRNDPSRNGPSAPSNGYFSTIHGNGRNNQ